MNKLISISMATALAAFVVACSSDKELPEYAAGLSVVKAQTAFGVLGGTQEVTLAAQPAQAYAQDAWLTVATKAETIALTAETNTSAQTRNTLLVIKNQQGDSITLNVQQEGVAFGLPVGEDIYTGDEAFTKSFTTPANVPVTYQGTENWITVEDKGGAINVKLAANATGKPRVGWVTAKAVGLTDSLKVVQAALSDVEGEYIQTALMRLPNRELEEKTTDVRIVATGANTANFIVEGKYSWEVAQVTSSQTLCPADTEYAIELTRSSRRSGKTTTEKVACLIPNLHQDVCYTKQQGNDEEPLKVADCSTADIKVTKRAENTSESCGESEKPHTISTPARTYCLGEPK